MQISKINFNLRTPKLTPKKTFSNTTSEKLNFKAQDSDIFIKSDSFSNEAAKELLRTKLLEYLTKEESNSLVKKLEQTCEQLGVEIKNLPIDEEHPGNLTNDQLKQISFVITSDAIVS